MAIPYLRWRKYTEKVVRIGEYKKRRKSRMVETFPEKTLLRFQKNAILPTDKQNQPLIRSYL